MENKEKVPNPSAFARSANYVPGSLTMTSDYDNTAEKGMSLRDYFAAKAMQSTLSRGYDNPTSVAMSAYRFAEAMLKERMKYED